MACRIVEFGIRADRDPFILNTSSAAFSYLMSKPSGVRETGITAERIPGSSDIDAFEIL